MLAWRTGMTTFASRDKLYITVPLFQHTHDAVAAFYSCDGLFEDHAAFIHQHAQMHDLLF